MGNVIKFLLELFLSQATQSSYPIVVCTQQLISFNIFSYKYIRDVIKYVSN